MLSGAAGIARLMNLEGPDVAVFMFSNLIGFIIEVTLPRGPWSGWIGAFVSYHLFLAWLLITADDTSGLRLRLMPNILTHLACLAAVCGGGMLRRSIPYYQFVQMIPGFYLLRYGVAGFALFERNWIVSGSKLHAKEPEVERPLLALQATVEDDLAWQEYLAKRNVSHMKPGISVREEYELWLKERMRIRSMARMQEAVSSGD